MYVKLLHETCHGVLNNPPGVINRIVCIHTILINMVDRYGIDLFRLPTSCLKRLKSMTLAMALNFLHNAIPGNKWSC